MKLSISNVRNMLATDQEELVKAYIRTYSSAVEQVTWCLSPSDSFCKAMGWKPWIGLIAACLFGLLDETMKIFLPTREFGPTDVLKDFIGAGIAFGVIMICVMLKNRASKAFILRQG